MERTEADLILHYFVILERIHRHWNSILYAHESGDKRSSGREGEYTVPEYLHGYAHKIGDVMESLSDRLSEARDGIVEEDGTIIQPGIPALIRELKELPVPSNANEWGTSFKPNRALLTDKLEELIAKEIYSYEKRRSVIVDGSLIDAVNAYLPTNGNKELSTVMTLLSNNSARVKDASHASREHVEIKGLIHNLKKKIGILDSRDLDGVLPSEFKWKDYLMIQNRYGQIFREEDGSYTLRLSLETRRRTSLSKYLTLHNSLLYRSEANQPFDFETYQKEGIGDKMPSESQLRAIRLVVRGTDKPGRSDNARKLGLTSSYCIPIFSTESDSNNLQLSRYEVISLADGINEVRELREGKPYDPIVIPYITERT